MRSVVTRAEEKTFRIVKTRLTAFKSVLKLLDDSEGSNSSKHQRSLFSSASPLLRYSPRNRSTDMASTDGFSAKMTSTTLYISMFRSSKKLQQRLEQPT